MVTHSGNIFATQNGTKRKSESKIELIFNRNKKSKSFLYSTTVATIMAKYLNSAIHLKLKENTLHVLLDSGSDENFINKR